MTRTLLFSQPKALQYTFIISEDDSQIGSLTYKKVNHRQANATVNNHQWTLVQKGFLYTKIYVYQNDTEEPVATYNKSFIQPKGTVTLDGKEYFLRKSGLLHSRYIWTDQQRTELITYTFGGILKTKGGVMITDGIDAPWELLTLLGLFAGINREESDASAAASGASS